MRLFGQPIDATYKKVAGIYAIVTADGICLYIGSSLNLYQRMHQHLHLLRKNQYYLTLVQQNFMKNNVNFIVLEKVPSTMLRQKEQEYLDIFKPLDNRSPSAASNKGFKHAPETVESFKKRKHSQATRKKLSELTKNQKWTKEHLETRRLALQRLLNKPIVCSNGVVYNSLEEASKALNIPASSISRVVRRVTLAENTRHKLNFTFIKEQ